MAFNFEEFVEKYYVHPETIAFIKARVADNVKPYYEVGLEEARKTSLAAAAKYGGSVEFDGTEKEIIIPSPYSEDGIPASVCHVISNDDGIPVTVYRPTSCDGLSSPPILVYFHGGGNTVGSRKSHETVCKVLAKDTPCIVVNVEYRLAPEHKFPANNDDAKCATEWVAANKRSIGGSESSKLGVSGDSAGGKLAAIVCFEVKVDFAVLIYPNVTMRFEHPSVEEFKDGPGITKNTIDWFTNNYITEKDKTNPRASVILKDDFSCVPPTLFIVADLDPLRDGCYAYYEKLKAAGVKTETKTIKGVPHAFWSLAGAFPENCKEAYETAVRFIRENGS